MKVTQETLARHEKKKEALKGQPPRVRAYFQAHPETVLTFTKDGDLMVRDVCPRCWGSGRYSRCETWGTTCFQCGYLPGAPGRGYVLFSPVKWVDRAKRRETADKRYQARLRHQEEELQAQRDRNPGGLTDYELLEKMNQERRQEKLARLAKLQYLGTVGEHIQVSVAVKKVVPLETRYGSCTLHIMEDEDGNQIRWFASGRGFLREGEVIEIIGRVKKHEDYKGQKQTLLTHVKRS